jgi:hypothetical protein
MHHTAKHIQTLFKKQVICTRQHQTQYIKQMFVFHVISSLI